MRHTYTHGTLPAHCSCKPRPVGHLRHRAQKNPKRPGNEHQAFAVYTMMLAVQKYCPIYTLCVGNAFGEAALLLAAGSQVWVL